MLVKSLVVLDSQAESLACQAGLRPPLLAVPRFSSAKLGKICRGLLSEFLAAGIFSGFFAGVR